MLYCIVPTLKYSALEFERAVRRLLVVEANKVNVLDALIDI